jgi:hypothetical protein
MLDHEIKLLGASTWGHIIPPIVKDVGDVGVILE